jgi:serine protease Do
MNWIRQLLAAFTLSMVLLGTAAQAAPPESFAPIIEPLMPAVVNISTTQKVHQQAQMMTPMFDFDGLPDTPQGRQLKQLFRQFGQPQGGMQAPDKEVTSLGSGFVIEAKQELASGRKKDG